MRTLNHKFSWMLLASGLAGMLPGTAAAQLASAPTQGGVAPVYTSDTTIVPLAAGTTSAVNSATTATATTTPNSLPGTIVPLPNPYTTHKVTAPEQATTMKSTIPNEGEVGKDGKVVHYVMAGKDPNTGWGILRNVQLPQRSFGDIDN